MKVYNYLQIRVAANRNKHKTDTYIFHEINELKQKYFWFQLNGIKEEIATIITKNWRDNGIIQSEFLEHNYFKIVSFSFTSIADFSILKIPFSVSIFVSSISYQLPSFVLYNLQEN